MSEHAPLEAILRLCAAAAPVPWHPKTGAAGLGLTDDDLVAFVEQLRGGGLVSRTDAVAGYGRGYVLTPAGVRALRDPGALEWLRRGEIPPRAADTEPDPIPAVSPRERAVRMSLLAPFTPYVVYALIAANVGMFLWAVYLGRQQGLALGTFVQTTPPGIAYRTGAIKPTDALAPGWGLVRLLTCCFVHFGLIHLAVNMISLHLAGPLLERMWGHGRFLVLYLVSGFGGSCAAIILKPAGGTAELAGASGAFWGILTSMVVWVVLNHRYMPRRMFSTWGVQLAIAFAINIGITYMVPGVSAEGHFGGGAVGAVCALLLHFTRFGPFAVRVVATAAVAALPVFGLWAVTHPARFNTDWELLEMNERYLPPVQRADEQAREILQHSRADLLLIQNPTRRDQDAVNDAVAKYEEASQALQPAADVLRGAGPYHDPGVEDARQVRLRLVEAKLELWALQERCLKDAQPWPGNDKKNMDQIDRLDDLEKEWQKARHFK